MLLAQHLVLSRRFCRSHIIAKLKSNAGLHSTYKYCDRHSIPYKKCGKLVVATDATEIGRLDALYERATQNGVPDIELVDSDGIRQREPICKGLKAIWEGAGNRLEFQQLFDT